MHAACSGVGPPPIIGGPPGPGIIGRIGCAGDALAGQADCAGAGCGPPGQGDWAGWAGWAAPGQADWAGCAEPGQPDCGCGALFGHGWVCAPAATADAATMASAKASAPLRGMAVLSPSRCGRIIISID
jgi:hypothetical protein